MKKSTLAVQGVSGALLLTLISAFSQADSISYEKVNTLKVNMADAAQMASQAMPGSIVEAELEVDDDKVIWEIELVDDSEQILKVEIDANTGLILSTELDDEHELQHADVISLANAIDIIMAVESGALIEAELENENNDLIWEIETLGNNEQENKYRIRAETGEILI